MKFKGKTDWEKVKFLTEEDIERAASSDPDAPLLTKEELRGFKRANPNIEFDVKFIRNRQDLTQEEFSSNYGINKRTLQGWEQRAKKPSETEVTFLKVIDKYPEEVKRMVRDARGLKVRSTQTGRDPRTGKVKIMSSCLEPISGPKTAKSKSSKISTDELRR
jgi:putative transcriptional regulator